MSEGIIFALWPHQSGCRMTDQFEGIREPGLILPLSPNDDLIRFSSSVCRDTLRLWSIVDVQRGCSCYLMPQRWILPPLQACKSTSLEFHPYWWEVWKNEGAALQISSYTQQQSQFLTSRLKPAGLHLLDQQGQEQRFPTGGLRAKSGSKNRSGGVANSWAKKLT